MAIISAGSDKIPTDEDISQTIGQVSISLYLSILFIPNLMIQYLENIS
jgi:hypothetical protein